MKAVYLKKKRIGAVWKKFVQRPNQRICNLLVRFIFLR